MGVKGQWNKHGRFGLAVDMIGAAIKGVVLYCVLLLMGFWGYQDGRGRFLPWLYLPIIPFVIALAYIYHKKDGGACVGWHVLAVLLWSMLALLAQGNRLAWIAAGLLATGGSLVNKFIRGDSDTDRHVKRFKLQNHYKWGVCIWALYTILYIQSSRPSAAHPLSQDSCGRYMIAAFIVYLILVVMLDYTYTQYDYFRKRTGVDENTVQQVKRMNVIVAVLVSVLIILSMLCASKTLAAILSKILFFLLGTAAAKGIWWLQELGVRQIDSGVFSVYGRKAEGLRKTKGRMLISENGWKIFFLIGLCVLTAVFIYVLWKIYKNRGANYVIGEDEAEYIPVYKEKKMMFQRFRKEHAEFEDDNRGKIRRMYYNLMKGRMKGKDMEKARGKTPQELADLYGTPANRAKLRRLTRYYEKARYSDEECEASDVKNVKNLTEDKDFL